MTNVPVRGLGSTGVVTDVGGYNLPITAFTRAKNVRFNNGNVSAGPVFRSVSDNISYSPKFCYALTGSTTYDTILVVDDTFDLYEFTNGTGAQRFNSSLSTDSTAVVSATTLADVIYCNRSDTVPLSRTPGQTNFTALANWPSNHKAKVIRSYGDFLLALDMTEGSTSFPNRIRFSDSVVANSIPSTWDASDTTNSAGFNDLVQMQTPIQDGATLGPNFLIYSRDQVWVQSFVGGSFIFQFRKLFDDAGIINTNCVVEVENKHYVLDRNDIYVTDGNTRQSICDGTVRDYIFSGLDNSKTDVCFVMHNSKTEEIYFCYNSQDDLVGFGIGGPGVDRCNRAAVYNYKEGLWSFQDLPNVVSGTEANINTTQTYASQNTQYEFLGGSYKDQDSPFTRHPIVLAKAYAGSAGTPLSNSKLFGVDLIDTGSINSAIDVGQSKLPYLERRGLDLDELGVSLDGYKNINKILPQLTTTNSDSIFSFTFQASDIAPISGPLNEAGATNVEFNSTTEYKIDTRLSGRYLDYRLSVSHNAAPNNRKDFSFSGMDIDVVVTGKR